MDNGFVNIYDLSNFKVDFNYFTIRITIKNDKIYSIALCNLKPLNFIFLQYEFRYIGIASNSAIIIKNLLTKKQNILNNESNVSCLCISKCGYYRSEEHHV